MTGIVKGTPYEPLLRLVSTCGSVGVGLKKFFDSRFSA